MIYFASDFHLGYPDYEQSRLREKKIVSWLDFISSDARQIHLVGDIFDFWFEWKKVVPKYFIRFLGKLAELTDRGIEVHFYIGNHDVWTFGYLEREIGLIVHKSRQVQTILDKTFVIEHGDQTPYESRVYKLMTGVFRNTVAQWLYANLLHPDWASALAQAFSSRRDRASEIAGFKGEQEKQIRFVRWLQKNGFLADYYVFGHRHLAYQYRVNNSQLTVLGEWMNSCTYAKFDGQTVRLLTWNS